MLSYCIYAHIDVFPHYRPPLPTLSGALLGGLTQSYCPTMEHLQNRLFIFKPCLCHNICKAANSHWDLHEMHLTYSVCPTIGYLTSG